MDSVRAAIMGRAGDEEPSHYVTTTRLNLREGPGTDFALVQPSPLMPGTLLAARASAASWVAVDVLDADHTPTANGWVHGDFIKPAP